MEVRTLLRSLRVEVGLEITAGYSGLDRRVTGTTVQKPGLVLAGFTQVVEPGRVQVLGRTEIDYLWSLEPGARSTASQHLVSAAPPVIIVTRSSDIPEQLSKACDSQGVPLLTTGLRTSLLVHSLHRFLANRLARVRSIHGVLVDVYGVGVLLVGKSGIGKSECALELVMRGHRLVADDVVDVSKKPPSTIVGSGNELIRHNMEIRGLGIINIKDLFGVAAIRETKRINLVIYFEEWDKTKQYERLGVDTESYEILKVSLPKVIVPVRPGRPLTSIVEVAARNQLLKVMGHHSAMEFQTRVESNLVTPSTNPKNESGYLPYSLTCSVREEDVE